MMRYRVTHTTKYAYSEAVPICQNKVHLRPRRLPYQAQKSYRLIVMPEPALIETETDFFGNSVEYFSLVDSHHGLSVTAMSEVEVHPAESELDLATTLPWEEVAEALRSRPPRAETHDCLFAFDSQYAAAADYLKEYALESFGPQRPIAEAARELTKRIFTDFEYSPRATTISTPLDRVYEIKAGVCQDFAHFQIACLRSLGLAARYVSGYLRTVPPEGKPRLVGADESHAWVSVYCGDTQYRDTRGWIDFDPTNDLIPSTDHVTVAYGRDYGDVCPIQGMFVGGGNQKMSVSVDVAPVDG